MLQRSGYDAWTRWWQKVRKGVYRPVLTSGRISCLTWSMFEHLSAVRTGRAIAFLAPPCDRDTNCACPRLTSLVGIHLLLKLRQSHTSATLPGDSAALLLMVALFVPDCHLATDAFVHALWECFDLVRKIAFCMCQWRYLTTHLSLSCQCFLNLVLPSP